jgi:spermidine/putrescine transport system ATP-binding protein
MAIIALQDLSKRFGEALAVDRVSLEIQEGEFFALLGPSGCGKTTLLRMLAGLEVPTAGQLLIDGQDMAGVAPNRRPVNMVFQSYAVFPHMSVADNVAYGLRMEGVAAAERASRVREALAQVQLDGLEARKPDQLSGGQRQRVALARALVKRPRVLLLDEPLSALDARLREQMRFELARLQKSVGITFVMVTHDQSEALALADRCAVMHQGRLEQVSAPAELYDRPASRFVADFIGQVNLFEGELTGADGGALLLSPELGAPVFASSGSGAAASAWAAIRPEQIRVVEQDRMPDLEDAPAGANRVTGVIAHAAYAGGAFLLEVELASGRRVQARREGRDGAMEPGTPVWLSWSARDPVILLS